MAGKRDSLPSLARHQQVASQEPGTTPSPSPSCATHQRAPSSSPQHPPTHPLHQPPSPAPWQPCHCSPVAASVCSPPEATVSAGHVTHSQTPPKGISLRPGPPPLLSHPPVPSPCAPHHVVSARLAPQPFSGSTQPSCWAIGSLFLPGFRIITMYNSSACLSSLECQWCTLRG